MKIEKKFNHSHIKFLPDIDPSNGRKFGAKALGIAKAKQYGATIPPGFSISYDLAKRITETTNTERYHKILGRYVEQLFNISSSRLMIVRSSSCHEDNSEGLFSGLFDSYTNIESTEELLLSIEKIVRNSKLPSLKPYFERYGLDINQEHMGIIVQSQINTEIGGIVQFGLERTLVEYTISNLGEALAGATQSNSFMIDSNSNKIDLNIPNKNTQKAADIIYSELCNNSSFYQYAIENNLTLEYAFADKKLYILQAKSTPVIDVLNTCFYKNIGNPNLANKTFAMGFFIENGLFSKQCEIIQAGWNLNKIKYALKQILNKNNSVTIRFSEGDSIGLPRAFVNNVDCGLNFVQSYGKRNYDIIIHDYINVIRSFEILITNDKFVIEHIPGMWESENTLNPDVIISRKESTKAYRYKKKRKVLLDDKTKFVGDLDSPISNQFIYKIWEIGDQIRDVMISKLQHKLPINVHLVWDFSSNDFQCLNIRPGFPFDDATVFFDDLYHVQTLSDLDGWDGKKPVRLALITKRGDERSLIAAASKLAESKNPIVVDFGLLSHPAMVLREYGCKLLPSYLIPNCFNNDEYEQIDLKIDVDSDPIHRIFKEDAVIVNDSYHVVKDRYPLSNSHHLCVSKKKSISAADTGCIFDIVNLYNQLNEKGESLFFERGRATFCTSGFTDQRDHFHIISNLDVTQIVQNIFDVVGGVRYGSLENTYINTPKSGEYIVFGSKKTGFFLQKNSNSPKRLLRRCVSELNISKENVA